MQLLSELKFRPLSLLDGVHMLNDMSTFYRLIALQWLVSIGEAGIHLDGAYQKERQFTNVKINILNSEPTENKRYE